MSPLVEVPAPAAPTTTTPEAPTAAGTGTPTGRRRQMTGTALAVTPWADPVIDELGHDPRSWYVETFWLGILGPSTTWLLRRLVAGFDASPDGFSLPLAETAKRLGLGDKGGRGSAFVRAIERCTTFHLARWEGADNLSVRRRVPPLTLRQLEHLSPSLQEQHRRYQESLVQRPTAAVIQERCRRLALTLLELGETRDEAEQQLLRWRFHPAAAHDAAGWADARRRHPSAQPR